MTEAVCEEELLLLTGPERGPGLGVFAFIGVILPGLLGVVIPTLEGLLLRGTKSVGDTVEDEEPIDLPPASSTGVVIDEFWLFGRPLRMPMLDSALPPAYDGRLLQQLHPVKTIPRLHAPIRPARGILPIVISSPV